MKLKTSELGIGMVEVLVALVLLAIGVLGYTALQLRAVDASNEALTRSQATVLLRSLTESMRANNGGQSSYPTAIQSYVSIQGKSAPKSCFNATCTFNEIATYDAYQVARSASALSISITMANCPGAAGKVKRQCLFAAWDDTELKATDYSKCMSDSGVYVMFSRCLMMEAY